MNNLSKYKLDGKIYVCRYRGPTQELPADSDEREGKGIENSRINNKVGRFYENINDEKISVVMESSSVWYNIYSYLSALLGVAFMEKGNNFGYLRRLHFPEKLQMILRISNHKLKGMMTSDLIKLIISTQNSQK